MQQGLNAQQDLHLLGANLRPVSLAEVLNVCPHEPQTHKTFQVPICFRFCYTGFQKSLIKSKYIHIDCFDKINHKMQ